MAVALLVLGFRGVVGAAQCAAALDALVAADDAAVRAAGWRAAAYLGAPADARHYAAAVRDDAPGVRAAALDAGAWAREPGVLAYGRHCATRRDAAARDAGARDGAPPARRARRPRGRPRRPRRGPARTTTARRGSRSSARSAARPRSTT
jgi:hypothetical protein